MGREIRCLPYAGFFIPIPNPKNWEKARPFPIPNPKWEKSHSRSCLNTCGVTGYTLNVKVKAGKLSDDNMAVSGLWSLGAKLFILQGIEIIIYLPVFIDN